MSENNGLKRKSTLILLGSWETGLLYQLKQVLAFAPRIFRPVTSYTTRFVSPSEYTWFEQTTYGRIAELRNNAFFTYYSESDDDGNHHAYAVQNDDVLVSMNDSHIALVGMNAQGYENFRSIIERKRRANVREIVRMISECEEERSSLIRSHFQDLADLNWTVVTLKPSNLDVFAQALETDYGFSRDKAIECARRAIISTTIPPAPMYESDDSETRLDLHVTRPGDTAPLSDLFRYLPLTA